MNTIKVRATVQTAFGPTELSEHRRIHVMAPGEFSMMLTVPPEIPDGHFKPGDSVLVTVEKKS